MSEPNETVNAAQQAPENDASVDQSNAALDALQQDLDAAVDAEPVNDPAVDADGVAPEVADGVAPKVVFAQDFGGITVDPSNNVFINMGKAPAPTKFKAKVGKAVVYAQVIKSYGFDKATGESYLVLTDGSKHQRPPLHGYAPKDGDYFVSAAPITRLSDDRVYVEAPETAIIGAVLFNSLYSPVTE